MSSHSSPSESHETTNNSASAPAVIAAEAKELIAAKRKEFVEAGGEPYAVVLDTDLYEAVYAERFELGAEEIIHDCYIRRARGCEAGVAWWSQRDYEKDEEAWWDSRGA